MTERNFISIVGARPQFIKAAVVSRALKKYEKIKEKVIHTGQHYDKNMSEIFFSEMEIPKPAWNLGIGNLTHGAMTGRMTEAIEKILLKEKPDCVIVYGDTDSTLAGAIAAKKLNIKLAHVEAGMRSFNMDMPEETNRILSDRVSDFLFCPTEQAVLNLKKEGFESFNCKILKSGDVMYDAALFYSGKRNSNFRFLHHLPPRFVIATFHRAENTNNIFRLNSIIKALNEINNLIPVIVPIHPRTKKIIMRNKIKTSFSIIEPVGYFEMIALIQKSQLVLTDSGGLQKESFFFEKPCITLRDETEWVELIENGFNMLAGFHHDKILKAFLKMSNRKINFNKSLYGKGNASELIAKILVK